MQRSVAKGSSQKKLVLSLVDNSTTTMLGANAYPVQVESAQSC